MSALLLAGIAVAWTSITVVHASTQVITVNTAADGEQGAGATCGSPAAAGRCTLRAAIALADRDSGDRITVPAGVCDLDPHLGVLAIRSAMTITGEGATTTVIDGGQATRVLSVAGGPVAISGLTVRNGRVAGLGSTGFGPSGANIENDGTWRSAMSSSPAAAPPVGRAAASSPTAR